MRAQLLGFCVLGGMIVSLAVGTVGCDSRPDHLAVLVQNESSVELHDVLIELEQWGHTQRHAVGVLKPKESMNFVFIVPTSDASFVVSATEPSARRIVENVGYVHHATREVRIIFADGSDNGEISVSVEVDW